MDRIEETFSNQIQEIRRGTIVLAILGNLRRPMYGYALLETLALAGIPVDMGTLYPLLRRMEKQGVLESTWDTSQARPRKFYRLSSAGEQLYRRLVDEWLQTNAYLKAIIEGGKNNERSTNPLRP